jgi:hypothetical protein
VGVDVTQGAAQAIQAALGFTDDDELVSVTAKPSPLTRLIDMRRFGSTGVTKNAHCSYGSA